ncbi:MAG TPA: 16S rRNA (cytosine(1402)-N(4))-methyltransferase RsmH, partial [Planctomycetota bacterium]|nr:16S rRNA (cytosine(1402)-N(4))-methyltransferase RsmH [Planctomycetota bacterium]
MDVGPTDAGGNDADETRHLVHVPVLLAEVLGHLALGPGMTVVDGTVGAGGHARAIALALGPTGNLVGLDRDGEILACARAAFAATAKTASEQARVSLHHLSYSRIQQALAAAGLRGCDRVLLDLGVSSLQLDKAGRGFSFMADGPLDMRMDTTAPTTAAAWLQQVTEVELARTLFELGDERHSRRIARALCEARARTRIVRTGQLAELIMRSLPPAARHGRIHPATRTFQAIRMVVNDELGELQRGLAAARACLRPGGRLCVIAFHSLEDRIVKR